jgi:hypothetical protein
MPKKERTQIVDIAETFLRRTGLTDKSLCTTLRIIHFSITFITILILLFGPKVWVLITMFLNILVYICFYLFEGCILSSLEHRFTNDEFTVIDPFIKIIGAEVTHANRYIYSLYSSIFGFLLSLVIYYIRFVQKEELPTTVL